MISSTSIILSNLKHHWLIQTTANELEYMRYRYTSAFFSQSHTTKASCPNGVRTDLQKLYRLKLYPYILYREQTVSGTNCFGYICLENKEYLLVIIW